MRTAYLDTLYNLAEHNKNVIAMISDNGAIVYDRYRDKFPKQFLNVGISEAHMLGMAAGMASRGKIPFAYTIGSFLAYRALEFIRLDICQQNENVKIVGIGAGMSYSSLGVTHHTTEDIAALRAMPNLLLLSPCSPKEVKKATLAAYSYTGPVYMRIGTNKEKELYEHDYEFVIGEPVILKEGEDVVIFGTGSILSDVIDVANKLDSEGISCKVVNIHTLNPVNKTSISQIICEVPRVITVEDHSIIGGLGSLVAEVIAESGIKTSFKRIGLLSFSKGYGTYDELKEHNGIGKVQICEAVYELLNRSHL